MCASFQQFLHFNYQQEKNGNSMNHEKYIIFQRVLLTSFPRALFKDPKIENYSFKESNITNYNALITYYKLLAENIKETYFKAEICSNFMRDTFTINIDFVSE